MGWRDEFKQGWREAGEENRRLWSVKLALVVSVMAAQYLLTGKLQAYTPLFWWLCGGASVVGAGILHMDRRQQRRK